MDWDDFIRTQIEPACKPSQAVPETGPTLYGSLEAEYQALAQAIGIIDRRYRALLEVQGRDRADWLHNLTTNTVKTLLPGEGNYAFACSVQGRILFDLIVMVRKDRIWLTLDRLFLSKALAHFNRYIVTEDVRVQDRTLEFAQIAIGGPKVHALLGEIGSANSVAMPQYAMMDVDWQGSTVAVFRNDFCGVPGAEFILPIDQAAGFWQWAVAADRHVRAVPVGDEAVQVHRIESGIPWPGHEITEHQLPAETQQLDRAVSFQKGCYLGQEVVERMRSRHVVANLLCAMRLSGNEAPAGGAKIMSEDGGHIGNLTSACRSLASGAIAALGYLKSAAAKPSANVKITQDAVRIWDGTIVELPRPLR